MTKQEKKEMTDNQRIQKAFHAYLHCSDTGLTVSTGDFVEDTMKAFYAGYFAAVEQLNSEKRG